MCSRDPTDALCVCVRVCVCEIENARVRAASVASSMSCPSHDSMDDVDTSVDATSTFAPPADTHSDDATALQQAALQAATLHANAPEAAALQADPQQTDPLPADAQEAAADPQQAATTLLQTYFDDCACSNSEGCSFEQLHNNFILALKLGDAEVSPMPSFIAQRTCRLHSFVQLLTC